MKTIIASTQLIALSGHDDNKLDYLAISLSSLSSLRSFKMTRISKIISLYMLLLKSEIIIYIICQSYLNFTYATKENDLTAQKY